MVDRAIVVDVPRIGIAAALCLHDCKRYIDVPRVLSHQGPVLLTRGRMNDDRRRWGRLCCELYCVLLGLHLELERLNIIVLVLYLVIFGFDLFLLLLFNLKIRFNPQLKLLIG